MGSCNAICYAYEFETWSCLLLGNYSMLFYEETFKLDLWDCLSNLALNSVY